VHHYRVNINGPAGAVAAVAAELRRVGARSSGSPGERRLVMKSEEGFDGWEALSRRHPRATLGLEWFVSFEEELVQAVVEHGEVTVMAEGGVLPDDFGSFHDVDGQPLAEDLLRAAAESIEARRDECHIGIADGSHIAVTMGKALGRFCSRVESTTADLPSDEALDAVIELAVLALSLSTSARPPDPAELEFEHALRLTQSVVHAGRSEFAERPGEACWRQWLLILVGATGQVVDAACHEWSGPYNEAHALGAEYCETPGEMLELEARALLTACLETLVLFDTSMAV
jgi:hypothetical protein